jgi:hypothetical protein
MMRRTLILLTTIVLTFASASQGILPETRPVDTQAPSKSELAAFQSRLLKAATHHLDLLIESNGKVAALKGKGTDGTTASAFYSIYEITGVQKYRTAAITLADDLLAQMKATKHGVIFNTAKQKATGETISGGGPPVFGWAVAAAAYIYHKEGTRPDNLKYLATIVDNYPWNEKGWWAATIDVNTGQPKEPIAKPSPVNKTASMAMAAGMLADYIADIDPELSARLKHKADQCIYGQIIPAQQADGFWHYGLTGKDPKNKDVLGYFMLTTNALIELQRRSKLYSDVRFQSALDKAYDFALTKISPMTDPNSGPPSPPDRRTAATPAHFAANGDIKRGLALGPILFGGHNFSEGMKVIDCWMTKFPYGNVGSDGSHAIGPATIILLQIRDDAAHR